MPTDDDDDAVFDLVADLGTFAAAARDDSLPPAMQDAAQSAAEAAAAQLADEHRRP